MFFVADVYKAKLANGDADAAQFADVAKYWLGNGMNATISGARRTISAILDRGRNETDAAKLRAFLRDLG